MNLPFYDHLSDYFRLCFQESGEFEDLPNYTRWMSSLPIFNFNGLLTKEELPSADLEKQLSRFRSLNLPHWWILHEQGPTSQTLERNGYHCVGHLDFVSLDLESVHPPFPTTNDRVHVKRVSNDEELLLWCKIICSTFFPGHRQEATDFLFAPYKKIGYGPDAPLSHYIGYLDGKPVGGSSLVVTKEIFGGLWNAAVLEQGRRQGVGTAMASARIKEAAGRNIKTIASVLMPDGMAWSYCKVFGFKEAFKTYPYLPKSRT